MNCNVNTPKHMECTASYRIDVLYGEVITFFHATSNTKPKPQFAVVSVLMPPRKTAPTWSPSTSALTYEPNEQMTSSPSRHLFLAQCKQICVDTWSPSNTSSHAEMPKGTTSPPAPTNDANVDPLCSQTSIYTPYNMLFQSHPSREQYPDLSDDTRSLLYLFPSLLFILASICIWSKHAGHCYPTVWLVMSNKYDVYS